jgi:transcriptional regulator with XRE-family HTH domain
MLHSINGNNMKRQNQLGKAFRQVRHARGLTQEDFAHESGRTYISELERCVKHPTLQKIDELTGPLKIHPLTLVALAYLDQADLGALEELLAEVRKEAEEIFRLKEQQK